MIAIEEQPGGEFVTIKFSGIVTRGDVDAALPRLQRIFEERSPLRLYVELVGLDRFEFAGLWQELKFQAEHGGEIDRVAFVVGSTGEEWAGWLAEQLTGGATRRFELGEEKAAMAWLRRR
jgi:hypothetical protein